MKRALVAVIMSMMCCLLIAGCSKKEADTGKDTVDAAQEDGIKEEDTEESPEADAQEQAAEDESSQEEIGADEDEQPSGQQEVKPVVLTEAECRAEIELLRGKDAVHPGKAEILTEMANCATYSRVIDDKGVIFSEMDIDRKAALRRNFIEDILWGENVFSGAIAIEDSNDRYEADKLIPVDEAAAFFKEVYGEDDFTPASYETIKDGYMFFSYGDGDPWHIVEHMQFFEDEGYYLLSGPSFYEDNGGTVAFKGYADILFAKNPDSRYGVTMLYGRYRDEKIKVYDVETSSNLPEANGKLYWGMNLVDDDPSTVWAEGVSGTGVGESITLKLDRVQPVFGVLICNGYTANYDLYSNNGMLTDVKVDFGEGKVIQASLDGYAYENFTAADLADCNQNKVELDAPVMTDTITITITGATRGAKYDDTCVSGVRVY